MSWIGWVILGIIALNVIFFGSLAMIYMLEDKGLRRCEDDKGTCSD